MSRMGRGFVIATSLFPCLVATRARADKGSDLSPDQLLVKTEAAAMWTHNVHMKLNYRTGPIGSIKDDLGSGPMILEQSGTGEIYASGSYLHVIMQNAAANGFDGAHVETLITPEFRIMWVKNSLVQYSDLKPVIERAELSDRVLPLMGWFLDSVFSDQIYYCFTFADAQRLGKIQPKTNEENVGAVACRVVDVIGDSWELRVWVAPARGYNFARYAFDSKADPKIKRAEFHCVVDQIQYQQLADGRWIIRGGQFVNTAPNSHGGQHGAWTVVDRTWVDLSPNFDKLKAFAVPPIPNGERVLKTSVDEEGRLENNDVGLKYMWENGKVVPAYDPGLTDRIRKLEEPQQPDRDSRD